MAVFLDAFVVRMTIVPVVMAIAGKRAWWLPGWLNRLLPSIDIEGSRVRPEPVLDVSPIIDRGPSSGGAGARGY